MSKKCVSVSIRLDTHWTDRQTTGADLNRLPSSSGRRSEFSGNFYAVSFIDKSIFFKSCLSVYLSVSLSQSAYLSVQSVCRVCIQSVQSVQVMSRGGCSDLP